MSQHLLHAAQVRAMVEQMGRESVPQDVRRDSRRAQAACDGELFQKLPHAAAGEMTLAAP